MVASGKEVHGHHTGASGWPWCLSSDHRNVIPSVHILSQIWIYNAGRTTRRAIGFVLNTVVH